ncbi:MAG: FecR family protein [Planctomycetes bacterium]|nr:FecR family protein [Planctomycetota bacterium]
MDRTRTHTVASASASERKDRLAKLIFGATNDLVGNDAEMGKEASESIERSADTEKEVADLFSLDELAAVSESAASDEAMPRMQPPAGSFAKLWEKIEREENPAMSAAQTSSTSERTIPVAGGFTVSTIAPSPGWFNAPVGRRHLMKWAAAITVTVLLPFAVIASIDAKKSGATAAYFPADTELSELLADRSAATIFFGELGAKPAWSELASRVSASSSVKSGDKLSTDDHSRMLMDIPGSGVTILAEPSTIMTFEGESSVRLEGGSLQVSFKNPGDRTFQVHTNEAVFQVVGTRFFVSSGLSGGENKSELYVYSGEVKVQSTVGDSTANDFVIVTSGMYSEFSRGFSSRVANSFRCREVDRPDRLELIGVPSVIDNSGSQDEKVTLRVSYKIGSLTTCILAPRNGLDYGDVQLRFESDDESKTYMIVPQVGPRGYGGESYSDEGYDDLVYEFNLSSYAKLSGEFRVTAIYTGNGARGQSGRPDESANSWQTTSNTVPIRVTDPERVAGTDAGEGGE